MKIVIPTCIKTISSHFDWTYQLALLSFVLREYQRPPAVCRVVRATSNCGEDMIVRVIHDGVNRVEPQTIKVEFVDPITGVGSEEFANRGVVLAVKIDAVAPISVVPCRLIARRKLAQIVTAGAKMVVNDVQYAPSPRLCASSTNRLKSSGVPYKCEGANKSTPS